MTKIMAKKEMREDTDARIQAIVVTPDDFSEQIVRVMSQVSRKSFVIMSAGLFEHIESDSSAFWVSATTVARAATASSGNDQELAHRLH